MTWVLDFLLTGVAVLILAYLLPGVVVKDYWGALWFVLWLVIFDAFVKLVFFIFKWPFEALNIHFVVGVVDFIAYLVAIRISDLLVKKVRISGCLWTLVFALLLSIVDQLIDWLLGTSPGTY